MSRNSVSQRTIVAVMRALRELAKPPADGRCPGANFTELLYENGFPDWFVEHAETYYSWDWTRILMETRSGSFFFPGYCDPSSNITGKYLNDADTKMLGVFLVERLAALATTVSTGDSVLRSLNLDGFGVDRDRIALVPLEGPVSAQEEEDILTGLVKKTSIPQSQTVLKHIDDAHALYEQGKYHASLNESRNLVQILIDIVSTETDNHGANSVALPAGTVNRIDFLKLVGFFTDDEKSAYKSAWGSLCAGSHPGVPEREQARIGLVIALEFGQLLLIKFVNWSTNGYCANANYA